MEKKGLSIKFVRKKRIYLRSGKQLYPFYWIEFLDDGSFSLGIISKEIKFTEYGSAIQRQISFKNHVQTLRRGEISVQETKAPHYTFHPPRISQEAGLVHMIDPNGKVDEWELDWFPVRKTQHLLTINSGQIQALGTVINPKRNYSIVTVPQGWRSLRMDMFISPVISNVELDPSAFDNVIGGCRHYNLICSFYKDANDTLCIYMASEM
jgi:hypothetical protein